MEKTFITTGSTFEEKMAYSRAVIKGDWIFVSGTTGYNYDDMTISKDIVEQTEQCLKNIEDVLKKANSKMSDVVRVTYILPNGDEFEKCFPVLKKYFDNARPAATMLIADLADASMKIEIQVTAIKE